MKTLITILILLTSFEILTAQVTQEWVATYNNGPGDESDGGELVAVDGLGNVYVTGRSIGSITSDDYVTLKYNIEGDQQWVQRYNGPGNLIDKVRSIAIDNSGNIYVTGISYGSGTNYDYATIKYSSAGFQQWVARYNGPANFRDEAQSVAVDGSGNVYVTGSSSGSGSSDYVSIKYNSEGVEQWVARFSASENSDDGAYAIALDVLGNVYVTGSSHDSGTTYDYVTIKYNSSGIEQWISRYNGTGNGDDYSSSIVIDNSGNIYITGYSIGIGTDFDYASIKYNSAGIQQWVNRYNGSGSEDDYAKSIVVDASENVYVTGRSFGIGSLEDYATIKYNSIGDQQWVSRYNGPGNSYDYPNEIVVDDANNIYITGLSFGSGTSFDCATIKYNSDGIQKWVARYNGLGNESDGAKSIVLTSSENIIVTGFSNNSSGTDTYCITIKYSQSVGINQLSSGVPDQFSLSQNYPNPFNPTTKIEFSLPEKSFVKLKVYDITGKSVTELVNESLSAGTFQYIFNAGDLTSGLYFYKLKTDKFSETKRMILLK